MKIRFYVSVVILFLLYFREVITASLQIPTFQKYLIFIIPSLYFVRTLWSFKADSYIYRIQIILFYVLSVSLSYIIYLIIFTDADQVLVYTLVQNLLIFQFFPFIINFSSLNIKMISEIMEKISLPFVWIASIYLIIQSKLIIDFKLFTPSEAKSWLSGYPVEYLDHPGFEGTMQASTMTIAAFTSCFLVNKLLKFKDNVLLKDWIVIGSTILVSHYVVLNSGSITNTVMFLAATIFIFAVYVFKTKNYMNTSLGLLFFSIPVYLMTSTSFTLRKFERYMSLGIFEENLTYRDMVVDNFVLFLKDCEFRMHALQKTASSFCNAGEIHVLSPTIRLGLIPDLPRLLAILAPLILFILILKNKHYDQYPLAVFGLVLLAGSAHYDNVANWPNIFVYQIIVYALLRSYKYNYKYKELSK